MPVLLWTLFWVVIGIGTWMVIDISANRLTLALTVVLENIDPP
jgi:hypothetical protein